MLWALGAILLQFSAIPQLIPSAASMATVEVVRPVPAKAEMVTERPATETASDAGSPAVTFEPGRLTPTPVANTSSAEPLGAYPSGALPAAVISDARLPVESLRRQRAAWIGLAVAAHGAAAFDAWSTRRAISTGNARELNPLLRPFAGNASIYAATQVTPALLDYVGKRMMTSRHGWARQIWWLPQVLGTAASVAAGVHNLGVR